MSVERMETRFIIRRTLKDTDRL